MKADRLFSILMALQKGQKLTAPELAKRFDVSRRTIGRDLDDLIGANFPIITTQGNGGGIEFADGYELEKSLQNKQSLIAHLTELGVLHPEPVGFGAAAKTPAGQVDSSKATNIGKPFTNPPVTFNTEPKISSGVWPSGKTILPAQPFETQPPQNGNYKMAVLFERSAQQKLFEQVGRECVKPTKVGKLRYEGYYDDLDKAASWVLSYGDEAQVLSPTKLVEEVRLVLECALQKYSFLDKPF